MNRYRYIKIYHIYTIENLSNKNFAFCRCPNTYIHWYHRHIYIHVYIYGILTMACTGEFVYEVHNFILLQLNFFDLVLIESEVGLSIICCSCGFDYQKRVLKEFLALVVSAP